MKTIEERRAHDRARYPREAARRKADAKRWRELNPERARELARKGKEKRREKIRREGREYYARNKESIQAKRSTPEALAKRNEWQKRRRKEAPQVFRSHWLRNAYGITQAQWDALLAAQSSCCAICESPDPGGKKGWHTDHCHTTGRVRGILCRTCNTGLGKLGDDLKIVRRAAKYLSA